MGPLSNTKRNQLVVLSIVSLPPLIAACAVPLVYSRHMKSSRYSEYVKNIPVPDIISISFECDQRGKGCSPGDSLLRKEGSHVSVLDHVIKELLSSYPEFV